MRSNTSEARLTRTAEGFCETCFPFARQPRELGHQFFDRSVGIAARGLAMNVAPRQGESCARRKSSHRPGPASKHDVCAEDVACDTCHGRDLVRHKLTKSRTEVKMMRRNMDGQIGHVVWVWVWVCGDVVKNVSVWDRARVVKGEGRQCSPAFVLPTAKSAQVRVPTAVRFARPASGRTKLSCHEFPQRGAEAEMRRRIPRSAGNDGWVHVLAWN